MPQGPGTYGSKVGRPPERKPNGNGNRNGNGRMPAPERLPAPPLPQESFRNWMANRGNRAAGNNNPLGQFNPLGQLGELDLEVLMQLFAPLAEAAAGRLPALGRAAQGAGQAAQNWLVDKGVGFNTPQVMQQRGVDPFLPLLGQMSGMANAPADALGMMQEVSGWNAMQEQQQLEEFQRQWGYQGRPATAQPVPATTTTSPRDYQQRRLGFGPF